MPILPTLFTIEGLAVELGHDRRTIGRAMRDTPRDGEVRGKPAWKLTSALKVLNRRAGGSGTGSEGAAAEIEELAEKIDADFARAAKISDLDKRRVFLKQIGPNVGKLDRLMESVDDGDIICELLHREALRDCVLQFNELWGPVQAPSV